MNLVKGHDAVVVTTKVMRHAAPVLEDELCVIVRPKPAIQPRIYSSRYAAHTREEPVADCGDRGEVRGGDGLGHVG